MHSWSPAIIKRLPHDGPSFMMLKYVCAWSKKLGTDDDDCLQKELKDRTGNMKELLFHALKISIFSQGIMLLPQANSGEGDFSTLHKLVISVSLTGVYISNQNLEKDCILGQTLP